MNIFILKLVLTPIIIGATTLVSRKWGASISGWLVGLPLTSGPVVFFIALSHELDFTYQTILGIISGGFSLVAYILVYAWVAKKLNWLAALLASLLTFFAFTFLLQSVDFSFVPLSISVLITIFIGFRCMPTYRIVQVYSSETKWDIPLRILIGTSFIILVTAIAPHIGAKLSGLISTVPLFVSILTVFTHYQQSADAAINVLRGLMYGLFAFASFYFTLGSLIPNTSLAVAFVSAIVVALLTQGLTLMILNNRKSRI